MTTSESPPVFTPVFIKGHLNFSVDNFDFEFIHQNISVFGVNGLPWGRLNPKTHFGKPVSLSVRVPSRPPLFFNSSGYISREYTSFGEQMGVKFQLDPATLAKLSALIQTSGFYPTEYLRKYPRIPADTAIQTFPLRVIATPPQPTTGAAGPTGPVVFDLTNLSPNGVLIHTENQQAIQFSPGQRIQLSIEPRGWFPMPVKVEALVCRIEDELNTGSGNIIRYLGLKFVGMDETNRTIFLDLLKDILSRIKNSTSK